MRANEINDRPLHPREMAVLLVLWHKGPCSIDELLRAITGWPQNVMERRLEVMRANGLIKWDKRGQYWVLTERGREVARSAVMDDLRKAKIADKKGYRPSIRMERVLAVCTIRAGKRIEQLVKKITEGEA